MRIARYSIYPVELAGISSGAAKLSHVFPGQSLMNPDAVICAVRDIHIFLLFVVRNNITDEEKQTNVPVPTFLMFNMAGEVVNSWGDPEIVPTDVHGCSFDADDNLWVGGNGDSIVQGYSHEGELLLQIGTKHLFDTSDGTEDGEFTNMSRERLYTPSGAVVEDGEVFISDGYGNKRVGRRAEVRAGGLNV